MLANHPSSHAFSFKDDPDTSLLQRSTRQRKMKASHALESVFRQFSDSPVIDDAIMEVPGNRNEIHSFYSDKIE